MPYRHTSALKRRTDHHTTTLRHHDPHDHRGTERGHRRYQAQRQHREGLLVDWGQSFWLQEAEYGRVADPESDHASVYSFGWFMA